MPGDEWSVVGRVRVTLRHEDLLAYRGAEELTGVCRSFAAREAAALAERVRVCGG